MAYAILRTQKLKSAMEVHRSLKHAFREQETPNADADRTPENSHIGASSSKEAMAAFRARLPDQIRKNGVLAIEYLVAGSPEGMHAKDRAGQDDYFRDALRWLRAKHGAENVVYAGIHRDETTPHMYAYVVPRVGDKLNCRHFLGGAKALSEMQTDFADKVGKVHGLDRGLERSKARHTTIREFYSRVGSPIVKTPALAVPEPSMGDRLNPRAYGDRVAQSVVEQLRPAWDVLLAKAKERDLAQKQASEARAAVLDQDKRLKPLVVALGPLNQTDRAKLVDVATAVSHKIVQARKDELREKVVKQVAEREAKRGRDRGAER